jgi:hypothetical protein
MKSVNKTMLLAGVFIFALALNANAQVQTETNTTTGKATKEVQVERGEVVTVAGNDLVVKMEDGGDLRACGHKQLENSLVQTHDASSTAFAIGEPGSVGKRFEAAVRSRSRSKSFGSSISFVVRQHPFPSQEPGVFIRASPPRLSTSCRGAMANAATENLRKHHDNSVVQESLGDQK